MIENILLNLFNNNKVTDISYDKFLLPIEYLNDKIYINDSIKNDLELDNKNNDINNDININEISNNTLDNSNINVTSLYKYVFNPQTDLENNQLNKWSKYYTNNKVFLTDTQYLLSNYNIIEKKDIENHTINEEINNISDISDDILYTEFNKLAQDKYFIDKYQYIDIPYFNKYNNNEYVLEILSLNNLLNPLLTLLMPIIFLLLPFIIIKLQNNKITIETYISYLKLLFKNHIIGKALSGFSQTSLSNKIYILFSIALYIFQIYQNYNLCIKFYNNIKFIHIHLKNIKNYLKNSIIEFNNLLKCTSKLETYKEFNNTIKDNIIIINNYVNNLNRISDYKFNIKKITELGHLMKCFYLLNNDKKIVESLYYCFNLNTYINNISNLQKNIKKRNMNLCNFIDNNSDKSSKIKNQYYAPLLNDKNSNGKIIKNSINLDKNIIISGPNASGKTTILKSSIFNVILSQQLGCGFFDSAELKIYDVIHCYLNIPDTSNRDSLFQAEARRCKEIITSISENTSKNHFCIFDELYSGTNPDEAIKSGYHFLKYINSKNVNFLLTTHYTKLCKQLNTLDVSNYKMSVKIVKNDFKYTYKLTKGISKIKGGIKVLKDLQYPEQIIENIDKNL